MLQSIQIPPSLPPFYWPFSRWTWVTDTSLCQTVTQWKCSIARNWFLQNLQLTEKNCYNANCTVYQYITGAWYVATTVGAVVARNKAVVAKITATIIAATTASTPTLLFTGKHIHSFDEMQTTWVNKPFCCSKRQRSWWCWWQLETCGNHLYAA